MNLGVPQRPDRPDGGCGLFFLGLIMAGITLAEAETHLTTWLDADKAVAKAILFD